MTVATSNMELTTTTICVSVAKNEMKRKDKKK